MEHKELQQKPFSFTLVIANKDLDIGANPSYHQLNYKDSQFASGNLGLNSQAALLNALPTIL